MHGVIMHGEQYLSPDRRAEPTTYYGQDSGVGRLIQASLGAPLRVGVIGLGTGTLATYGRVGDVYRFYEINPQVVDIAHSGSSFKQVDASKPCSATPASRWNGNRRSNSTCW
jgi:hypothetical protein